MTQHNIDLSQYGIKAPAEIIYNPSYDQLYEACLLYTSRCV